MTNRRNFIKKIAAAGIASTLSPKLFSDPSLLSSPSPVQNNDMIWANLIHLGFNFWTDHTNRVWGDQPADKYSAVDYEIKTCEDAYRWAHGYRPFLTFDDKAWDAVLHHMVERGMNMVIIDLGDGVKYQSHPEIAVENAWSTDKLKAELMKMRKMGLEPIPKLNFSTSHQSWLGEYRRMVSTEKYYTVRKNLINEVIDLFDTPRFFHLGMDEETSNHQKRFNYAVVRQNDLWWHDFYLLTEQVEKNNVRPWIWSDYAWRHPDEFFKRMPKSVLQSNWYYEGEFDIEKLIGLKKSYVELYNDLEKYGYDQVPTGSNYYNDINMELTANHCKEIINPSRLKGFMMASWMPTMEPCINKHKDAIDQLSRVKNELYSY